MTIVAPGFYFFAAHIVFCRWQVCDNSLQTASKGQEMAASEQEQIYQMFDRIAPTYDAVNRVLSFGQDIIWRNRLCRAVPQEGSLVLLDIATGTADLLLAMCEKRQNIKAATGIDLSVNMLRLAQKKVDQKKLSTPIQLIHADGAALPFSDHSFDIVSIAFGIRNIVERKRALLEIERVLKPQGLLLVLEFSLPQSALIRTLYLAYFRYILPLIGGLISKEPGAYHYLNKTVEQFSPPWQFCESLGEAGFVEVSSNALSLGIATLYSARKPCG